ncbi:MAG: methionyl-tRNA formyltransferase, partial [Nitrospirae bacterium]|nr:methionyl-tRNA formyltransferase [Nitrospirota bacterium]
MAKIKTLLFGMTGFGNSAFKVLIEHPSVELIGVFMPSRQIAPFPYYECEKLNDSATASGVALYEGLLLRDDGTYELINKLSPELMVVSSFNQIVPESIISLPGLGIINVHPSLLPEYRGATPTVWALANGEEKTGVTVHFIEDERLDNGRIIAQSALKIDPMDNDGTLRQKLAALSEIILTEALDRILSQDRELFPEQDESKATYYPKRSFKDAEIDIHRPFREILNKIRAMSPYP